MDQGPSNVDRAVKRLMENCRGLSYGEALALAEAAIKEAITLGRWLPSILDRIERAWYGR
jgi:hypothetical protein